jgi:hypothetical protein
MTFPIDAINTLLAMVRRTVPFNLSAAFAAGLEIANYLQSVFGTASITSITETPDFTFEKALQYVKDQHEASVKTASVINASYLTYIIKMLAQWIIDNLQS